MNRCLNSFCRAAVNLSTGTLVLAVSRPISIDMSLMSNENMTRSLETFH
jgi:hypothetical protein